MVAAAIAYNNVIWLHRRHINAIWRVAPLDRLAVMYHRIRHIHIPRTIR